MRSWLSAQLCFAIAAIAAGLLLRSPAVAVAGAAAPAAGAKVRVIATTSIIADWAHIVGGDDITLVTLVGADGDPHEFEPAPGDTVAIANAKLVLENGLGLENWLDKLFAASRTSATRCVVTKGIEPRHVRPEENRPNGPDDDRDPHAWQSVKNATVMVGNIRDAMIAGDADHADAYKSRAAAYLAQLDELDRWVQTQIETIPPARRKLVNSHDAFGYFGQRYGMDISRNALESVTTEASDPSAKELADVVNQVKASGVPAIFLENIQNRRVIDQIAKEAGVKVGPPLYSDALGKPGSAGDTYLKMIHYNVDSLVTVLAP